MINKSVKLTQKITMNDSLQLLTEYGIAKRYIVVDNKVKMLFSESI